MPAATPLPSIVWPSRSIVMLGAPMTRPSQRQSARSFLTLMLVLITWPQKMKPGTGSEPTYHVNFAGDGSALPVMSVALTWNSRAPVGMPVYVLGDVHGSHASYPVTFSWHSNLRFGPGIKLSLPVNSKVAAVLLTLSPIGPAAMKVSGGSVSSPA